ncbi:MAG: response regulator [Pedobacter sp.]|nr:response regulator [Pedobacter sp.]
MAKHILVIENDEKLVEILDEFLTEQGYTLHFRPQAYDIVPIIKELMPDLVLLDFLLPGTNGGELCMQIKKNEQLRHIPVIIFTAFPRVLLALEDYRCNAFISKPFDLLALVDQIEACIKEPQRDYLEL